VATHSRFRAAPVLAAVTLVLLMSPSALLPQSSQKPDEDTSVETFKVSVEVVNLFINVKDKKGALIPGLAREDFEVYEDGKPQTIKYFAAESSQPLTLGILVDTSGSQARVLPMEQEVGAAFLKEVLREKDLAFIISFDVNVDLLQDYTSSARDLRRALERTRINTGGGFSTGIPGIGGGPFPQTNPRGTALYDAVYLAADEKLRSEVGRKAMIILTDGNDYGSRLKLRDAVEAAQKADAICYVLLIADRGFYPQGEYVGDSDMKRLAEDTGGRVVDVGNKYDKLKQAFDQIAQELRSQYNIGYTPTNTTRDGSFRKIEVRSRKGHRIQARKGYYAPRG
jgi:VWFA-related protein